MISALLKTHSFCEEIFHWINFWLDIILDLIATFYSYHPQVLTMKAVNGKMEISLTETPQRSLDNELL